ncbi:MAG: threonine--tRNA ligase [Fibrobacterales bacterium]
MSQVAITFPDGNSKEFDAGISGIEIAKSISKNLAKVSVAVKVNDEIKDLNTKITADSTVSIITESDPEGLEVIRHSTAHMMAMAVKDLYPGTLLAIGPTIEDGFYYDFDSEHVFSPEDFSKIEKKMKEISKKSIPFVRVECSRAEARAKWDSEGETYKVDLLDGFDDDQVSYYEQGDSFDDLCRGPHVAHSGKVKHFKLLSVAGAYWRGDQNNKMLQRLYATAFTTREALDEYLHLLEEAKKRDHRKIGKELDLFSFHQEGQGFPFWHAKGMRLYNKVRDYMRSETLDRGYDEVVTPSILNKELWLQSGHWDKYQDNMYFTDIDEVEHAVKPMNCPGGMLIYKNKPHSYRELPIRNFEFGQVHRHEKAGVLHGLFRVRMFTQDDAHIFCTEEQIEKEVIDVIDFVLNTYKDFGFDDFEIELSTRPEMRIGDDSIWDKAEEALRLALEHRGINYKLNPGDGAFYGPKIDFHIRDSLKRSWQCGTIQLDFSMPERFELDYVGPDGDKKRPVMLHRAIFGSFERFLGILTEHYAGDYPLWMHPEQIRVLPIADKYCEYAEEVNKKMKAAGFYSTVDLRNEKIGYKIREGENHKVPYLLIVGEKEMESGKVAIRKRKVGDVGEVLIDEAIERFIEEVEKKGT